MKSPHIIAGLVCGACAALAAAQSPLGAAFTYQGRLEQSGAPANGMYDLRFRLYDAPAAGTPIGPDVVAADQIITDGLLTAQVIFGTAPFDGQARWVEIAVFDDGSGQFVALSPRQALNVVPYAAYSLDHGRWRDESGALTNTDAGAYVGINTLTPASPSEVFGVRAPVQTGYGGMYIRTDGATAKPFYGYTTGPETAWTYLDGASGDWRLNNGGDRVTVTDSGRVGVNTNNPAASLHVQALAGTTDNALKAATYGTGAAANLESHQSNATPAVTIYKNGGTALEATGDAHIGGSLYAGVGAPLIMGTPIAFGVFEAWAGNPIIKAGTGNFSVDFSSWAGGFNVTVDHDSDPATWIVVVGDTYDQPENFGGKYEINAGIPKPDGSFHIVSRCYDDCGSVSLPYGTTRVHFVVYKP